MSEEIKVDKVMDLKGLPCPMPVVKVSKGIKEVGVGQVVEAITTDPGSLADFPAWAPFHGNPFDLRMDRLRCLRRSLFFVDAASVAVFLGRSSARLSAMPHGHRDSAAAACLEFRGRSAGSAGTGVCGRPRH